MSKRTLIVAVAAGAAAAGPMTGCKNLPGTGGQQGAVIGGAGGAVAGAAIARGNPLLGALIGGAVGAGGGYLIGAEQDKVRNRDQEGAMQSIQNAQSNPATPEQARNAPTADVNGDGYVTLDEVIAVKNAGFSDAEIIRRLRATNQVFELTADQQQQLRDAGVSQNVIDQMLNINRDAKQQLINQNQQNVVSHPK